MLASRFGIGGFGSMESNVGTTSAEFGTTVTAHSTIHTKNTTYATLIAATARDAYGITILLAGTGTVASTNARMLVDIAIGAASSEIVIIPNLLAGNVATMAQGVAGGCLYTFPVFIPAGVRLSANCQALISADTCTCAIWLHRDPIGPRGFVGSRVTAYGPDTATSSGVSHSPGNSTYATATQIVANAANPIRYLQLGIDGGTDTTLTSLRGLARIGIGATPDYIASELPFQESTTVETINNDHANLLLSRMLFNIPASTRLTVSAMRNAAAEARGWALYGVD